jgi:hypothetical protein
VRPVTANSPNRPFFQIASHGRADIDVVLRPLDGRAAIKMRAVVFFEYLAVPGVIDKQFAPFLSGPTSGAFGRHGMRPTRLGIEVKIKSAPRGESAEVQADRPGGRRR